MPLDAWSLRGLLHDHEMGAVPIDDPIPTDDTDEYDWGADEWDHHFDLCHYNMAG